MQCLGQRELALQYSEPRASGGDALSPTCTGPWNSHSSYQRDAVFTSLRFLGGPLPLFWIIDLVIILYYFILILNKVCHHYWRKLF